jgi:hypothetical protein
MVTIILAFEVQTDVGWRWAAIEVLKDRIFLAKSDVWSFGVTAWEIFSLGATPFATTSLSVNRVTTIHIHLLRYF